MSDTPMNIQSYEAKVIRQIAELVPNININMPVILVLDFESERQSSVLNTLIKRDIFPSNSELKSRVPILIHIFSTKEKEKAVIDCDEPDFIELSQVKSSLMNVMTKYDKSTSDGFKVSLWLKNVTDHTICMIPEPSFSSICIDKMQFKINILMDGNSILVPVVGQNKDALKICLEADPTLSRTIICSEDTENIKIPFNETTRIYKIGSCEFLLRLEDIYNSMIKALILEVKEKIKREIDSNDVFYMPINNLFNSDLSKRIRNLQLANKTLDEGYMTIKSNYNFMLYNLVTKFWPGNVFECEGPTLIQYYLTMFKSLNVRLDFRDFSLEIDHYKNVVVKEESVLPTIFQTIDTALENVMKLQDEFINYVCERINSIKSKDYPYHAKYFNDKIVAEIKAIKAEIIEEIKVSINVSGITDKTKISEVFFEYLEKSGYYSLRFSCTGDLIFKLACLFIDAIMDRIWNIFMKANGKYIFDYLQVTVFMFLMNIKFEDNEESRQEIARMNENIEKINRLEQATKLIESLEY